LQAAIGKKIKSDSPGAKDTTKIARILVVGVQRQTIKPGDRLLATTVSITPLNSQFRFTDFQAAATDRSVINIGSVSVVDQKTANVGVGPAAAATANAAPSASIAASRTETGTRNIITSAELSVHVEPERVQIYRSGTEGSDLTGNTLVKLALQLPEAATKGYPIAHAHLTDDDGAVQPPEKAKLDVSFLEMNPPEDIYVCASLGYEDRDIIGGEESYDEGHHHIRIKSNYNPRATPFIIVPAEDLRTPLWYIMSNDHSKNVGSIQFDNGLRNVTLYFDDYEDAGDFLGWLKKVKTEKIANGRLSEGTPQIPLPIADFSEFHVQRFEEAKAQAVTPTCPQPKSP
jgi:hypothetical protein